MMRIALVLFLAFAACNTSSTPKDILTANKMGAVWFDVIRADEWIDAAIIQDTTYRNINKRTALYDSIFRLHSVTKEAFKKSQDYYQSRPDLLKEILDSLYSKTDTVGKKPTLKPVIRQVIDSQKVN